MRFLTNLHQRERSLLLVCLLAVYECKGVHDVGCNKTNEVEKYPFF